MQKERNYRYFDDFDPYRPKSIGIKDSGEFEYPKTMYHMRLMFLYSKLRKFMDNHMRKHGEWLERESQLSDYRDRLEDL